MILYWPSCESDKNTFKLQKGMYFIGDLSNLFYDVSEEGDGIETTEIFSKYLIEDLNKTINSY